MTAEALRAALLDEVAAFTAAPPSPAEVERARRLIEVGLLSTLENLASRINQLADWAAYFGDPDHLAETQAALAAVTPASVAAAAGRWLRVDAAVVMVVRPEPAAAAGGAP